MIERMRKRFAASTAKWWLSIGALLGVGMLPCPDCGAPMIVHFWPLAAMVLALRAMKRRYRREQPPSDGDEDRTNKPADDRPGIGPNAGRAETPS